MVVTERNLFWDAVKGAAIIAVILIHTTSVNSVGGVIWRQFINWPVALFFFMAGYFCRIPADYRSFIVKKAKRLLVPLLVCSLVYALSDVLCAGRHGNPVSFLDLCRAFLSFPFGWGYFVLALFQCFLLAPVLTRLSPRRAVVVSFLLYLLTVLYAYLAATCCSQVLTLKFMFPYVLCTAWLPFFTLGRILRERRLSFVDEWWLWSGVLLLLCVVEVLTSLYWAHTATFQLARSQIRIASVAFSLALACGLPNQSDRLNLRIDRCRGAVWTPLIQLGQISFVVYLWHRLALIILKKFLPAHMTHIPWLSLMLILSFVCVASVVPPRWRKRLWFLGF